MSRKFKRVFVRWEFCEEYKTQMWKQVSPESRQKYIEMSANLMKAPTDFEAAMKRAVDEWPNSCKAALTAGTMNHQAWIGHAGCAINHDSPEDLTRLAWRTLSKAEQDAANLAADNAIEYWANQYEVDHA